MMVLFNKLFHQVLHKCNQRGFMENELGLSCTLPSTLPVVLRWQYAEYILF